MARKVRLVCTILLVLYVIGRMPFPLLVIPLVGCTVIFVANELEDIKHEKKGKKRNKKVTKKKPTTNS